MKIGILTFQNAVNYGAVLQTYALQNTVEKLGADAKVINYQCEKVNSLYDPFPKTKNAKKLISNILWYKRKNHKKEEFEKFSDKYLKLTEKKYYTKKDLEETNDMFDLFITGSDQIWRAESTNFDTTYFLDFVKDNRKKYSYAASFGSDKVEDKYKEEYAKMLNEYNMISVREKQGQSIVKDLINKEARIDLDPTFLLKKEDWQKIEKKPNEQKRYIILFIIRKSEKIFRFAEKLAKQKDCELIYISNDRKKEVNAKYVGGISPEEWLGYIDNAEYVITNSFHGTAFSIIYQKNFFLELQPPPAKANARLENIMDMLGLREREIINGDNANISKQIDYIKVEKILEEQSTKSIEYLKEIIKGDKS